MKNNTIIIEQIENLDKWNVYLESRFLTEASSINEIVKLLESKKLKGKIWLSFSDDRLPQNCTAFYAVNIKQALLKLSTDIASFVNVEVSKADFIKAKFKYRSRSVDAIAFLIIASFVSANFFVQNPSNEIVKVDFSPVGFQPGKPINFNPLINSSFEYQDDQNPAVKNLKQAQETQRKLMGLPPIKEGTKHE